MVITEEGIKITKLICEHCTPQNIAAFGVESFDPIVQEKNKLNSTNDVTLQAIKIINKYGSENNKFLPGLNIIFGLDGETKKTHEWNMKLLLNKFGIVGRFKEKIVNEQSYWRLLIAGSDNHRVFRDKIGFNIKHKAED